MSDLSPGASPALRRIAKRKSSANGKPDSLQDLLHALQAMRGGAAGESFPIEGRYVTWEQQYRSVLRMKTVGDRVKKLSDHDVHTQGVRLASLKGPGSKLLNKALDAKHDMAIRQFAKAEGRREMEDAPGVRLALEPHPAAHQFDGERAGGVVRRNHRVHSAGPAAEPAFGRGRQKQRGTGHHQE